MVAGGPDQAGGSQMAESLVKMLGLPSPEKMLGELQRLNNNLELLQPDIHKLASFFSGSGVTDIRNLTGALNKVDLGNALRTLNEFNHNSKMIYDKLWPK